MTTPINSAETLIERHRSTTRNINDLKAERSKITKELLSTGIEADEKIRADLRAGVHDAEKVLRGLNDALTSAERHKADLDKRIDSGDDTVTPLEALEADMAVRSTKGKIKPADAALRKARRAFTPFESDNHLALLAADALEDVAGVPVLCRKRPEDASVMESAVILSQTSPTEDYGTLSASGAVRVTVVGKPEIDWKAVSEHFESTGSDVDVSPDEIVFNNARWPIPRLSDPSEGAVRSYMTDFARAWHSHISGAEQAARMRAAGYLSAHESGWRGLFREHGIEMNVEDGKVVATVTFIAAGQHRTEELTAEGIISNLREIVRIFQQESIGGVTGAGEIVKVSLSDEFNVVRDAVWDSREIEWHMGNPMHPITLAGTVEIEFRYEQAEI